MQQTLRRTNSITRCKRVICSGNCNKKNCRTCRSLIQYNCIHKVMLSWNWLSTSQAPSCLCCFLSLQNISLQNSGVSLRFVITGNYQRTFSPTFEVYLAVVTLQVLLKMGKLYVQKRNDCRRMKIRNLQRNLIEFGKIFTLIRCLICGFHFTIAKEHIIVA